MSAGFHLKARWVCPVTSHMTDDRSFLMALRVLEPVLSDSDTCVCTHAHALNRPHDPRVVRVEQH